MTKIQQERLLRLHLTGDSGGVWSTMASLLKLGYVATHEKHLRVTPKGKAWCDANHMHVQLRGKRHASNS